MVAMVIFTIGLLGLLQSINFVMGLNSKDELRNAAVFLAEQKMNELRIKPFAAISSSYTPIQVKVKLRGLDNAYTVERYSVELATNSATPPMPVTKELQVLVKWDYRNSGNQHLMKSILSIPDE